ncbi:hypothetical protein ScPMuIL_011440, partial [Solemya velum]
NTVQYRSCVKDSIINDMPDCPSNVADFMGDYVTVLSGSRDVCQPDEVESSGSYSMEDNSFTDVLLNTTGSAIMECTPDIIALMTSKFNTTMTTASEPKITEIMDDALDIFCGEKNKLMTCLKEKMPGSSYPIDLIVLMFIDLDGTENVLNNYCEKRNVLTDNSVCLSSPATSEASNECIGALFENMNNITNLGFAMVDYICSAAVNITECLGKKLKLTCNQEVSDFVTSSYTGMLTPHCRNAKPRPVGDVMQPGWSYKVIPGGMVAMECILPTAAEMMKIFNNPSFASSEHANSAIVKSGLKIVCDDAERILDCLETKLRKGQSTVDKLTREAIDLSKLRSMVATECPKQDEIASAFPCFFQQNLQTAQQICMNSLTNEFMKAISGEGTDRTEPNPVFMLQPKKMNTFKAFLCGSGSAYKRFAFCEANAVRNCNAALATHTVEVMTRPIRDTCLTESEASVDGCVGPACSACSAAWNGLLWLLVGAVTLRWF